MWAEIVAATVAAWVAVSIPIGVALGRMMAARDLIEIASEPVIEPVQPIESLHLAR